jgi:uncharacterized protein YlxW (UPF0749 family)
LDILRKQTEEKKDVIKKLQIEHNTLVKGKAPTNSKTNAKNADTTESEIMTLGEEIEFLEKELDNLTDRRKKIHLVSD